MHFGMPLILKLSAPTERMAWRASGTSMSRQESIKEQRQRSEPLLIDPLVEYCWIRLAEDPHLWASTLFDELGFTGSYLSFVDAGDPNHGLRPHCEPCQSVKGRDVAIISHRPGVETQWDWAELT